MTQTYLANFVEIPPALVFEIQQLKCYLTKNEGHEKRLISMRNLSKINDTSQKYCPRYVLNEIMKICPSFFD